MMEIFLLLFKKRKEEIFRPAFHPHILERKIYNLGFVCDGCLEPGLGSKRFRCEECDFNFHDKCTHFKENTLTTHDFYKNNIFKFLPRPPYRPSINHACDMCAGVALGFVYYCEELNKCLHPCCHSLPSKFKFYHLEFTLRDKISSSTCLWCSEDSIEGLSYVSKCNKYNFHVSCAKLKIFVKYYTGNSFEQSFRGCLEIHFGGLLKRQRRRKLAMSFVISNLVLELSSAILDQVSSPVNKAQFALFGMLISFVAMLICIIELIYEFQTENLIWRKSRPLPFYWYYYPGPELKPFGTFKHIVGWVCGLCQCVFATVSYCYIRKYADNPIKISIFPIIFAFGILFSQILKNQEIEIPSRENERRQLLPF